MRIMTGPSHTTDDIFADVPKIGKSLDYKSNTVFRLIVTDFVPILKPPSPFKMDPFDPVRYFITSGDAIMKARRMSQDLWDYAGEIRARLNRSKRQTPGMVAFEKRCWVAAGKSSALLRRLQIAKGTAIFFETEWDHHTLLVCAKNPRTNHLSNK